MDELKELRDIDPSLLTAKVPDKLLANDTLPPIDYSDPDRFKDLEPFWEGMELDGPEKEWVAGMTKTCI